MKSTSKIHKKKKNVPHNARRDTKDMTHDKKHIIKQKAKKPSTYDSISRTYELAKNP